MRYLRCMDHGMVLSQFCKAYRVPDKTNTHIEVLPPSVYALRGIIFYTVAKINQIRIYKSKTINTSEYTLELYFSVSLNPTLRYKAIAFVLVDKESRNIFL